MPLAMDPKTAETSCVMSPIRHQGMPQRSATPSLNRISRRTPLWLVYPAESCIRLLPAPVHAKARQLSAGGPAENFAAAHRKMRDESSRQQLLRLRRCYHRNMMSRPDAAAGSQMNKPACAHFSLLEWLEARLRKAQETPSALLHAEECQRPDRVLPRAAVRCV